MLRTIDINNIPSNWLYEHYLNLTEPLIGQTITMKSLFNVKDNRPSFFIFLSEDNKTYLWKDFSINDHGSGVQLIAKIFNINRSHAEEKIINDYLNQHNKLQPPIIIQPHSKYRITTYKTRDWAKEDQDYWRNYNIPFKLLDYFYVKPLLYFKLKKTTSIVELTIKGRCIYGYFTKEGVLYKIYQPLNKDYKFYKIMNYTQGVDRISNKEFLIIGSSLKDIMGIKLMQFKNVDVIAPDSENTILSKDFINERKDNHKYICTLFDNDMAGMVGMQKYKDLYDIPSIHFKYEKDIARCIKIHGINNTRELLTPLLKQLKYKT